MCSRFMWWLLCLCFFFFQAEDGIRDLIVTGVQTCALPICPGSSRCAHGARPCGASRSDRTPHRRWIQRRRRVSRRAAARTWLRDRRDRISGRGDRKSVVEGKRVDLGGRRIIKKKKQK